MVSPPWAPLDASIQYRSKARAKSGKTSVIVCPAGASVKKVRLSTSLCASVPLVGLRLSAEFP